MSKSVGVLLGAVAAVWLCYLTWLTGYRAGYDDGSITAWERARHALAPHLARPATDGTPTAGESMFTGAQR